MKYSLIRFIVVLEGFAPGKLCWIHSRRIRMLRLVCSTCGRFHEIRDEDERTEESRHTAFFRLPDIDPIAIKQGF